MIRVVIIYDSVTNSVFESQVLIPLLKNQEQAYLITFEPQEIPQKIMQLLAQHSHIKPIVFRRFPFIGTINLWIAAVWVRLFLRTLTDYEIIARGPLAGWIALRAHTSNCKKIMIQARGLLAEEYAYMQQQKIGMLKHSYANRKLVLPLYPNYTFGAPLVGGLSNRAPAGKLGKNHTSNLRYRIFKKIEKNVYGAKCLSNINTLVSIQAVSTALKEYLQTAFDTPEQMISVAAHDIPSIIPAVVVQKWRIQTRNELDIPVDAFVYCYNGSAKSWQCPHLVINYFKEQFQRDHRLLLLIISQDKDEFDKLLSATDIPSAAYRCITVAHQDIYRTLAAADSGLLFREPHILNWISRPTKALEYQAVGLPIVHNDTVAMLVER